jgi:NADH-quinone oxidoreductase subunit L
LQTGFVRSYALSMLFGSVLVLGALLVVRFV